MQRCFAARVGVFVIFFCFVLCFFFFVCVCVWGGWGVALKGESERETSLTESTHKYIIGIRASSYFLVYHCMDILNCFKHATFIFWRILNISRIVFNKCSTNQHHQLVWYQSNSQPLLKIPYALATSLLTVQE
jgi:hypothetical protein